MIGCGFVGSASVGKEALKFKKSADALKKVIETQEIKKMEVKYYVCNHCGNIIEMVKDQGVPVMCCGEAMHELKAGVTDAAVEKHVPVYTVDKQHVHVVVGETKHPMLDNHFIEWITLNTNQGIYRKQLIPGQEPIADFCLCDGEYVEEVYAYCNLHGLWKC